MIGSFLGVSYKKKHEPCVLDDLFLIPVYLDPPMTKLNVSTTRSVQQVVGRSIFHQRSLTATNQRELFMKVFYVRRSPMVIVIRIYMAVVSHFCSSPTVTYPAFYSIYHFVATSWLVRAPCHQIATYNIKKPIHTSSVIKSVHTKATQKESWFSLLTPPFSQALQELLTSKRIVGRKRNSYNSQNKQKEASRQ